jgi:NAD(P)-dependent dehydrogenase (short-subunit alcohol dehydrogenase family)
MMSAGLPSDIRGRRALVTGAARNIGRGIAERLAEAGAHVIASDRDFDALERAFGGDGIDLLHLDLLADPAATTSAVLDRFGPPDLIVNNVGVTTPHAFLKLGEDDFDDVMHANLRGPWFLTKGLVTELIRARRGGSVVFISSLHDHRIRLHPHYSASKAAVSMLVRELAYELAPHSIRVNAISPGWVQPVGSKVPKQVAKQVPMGRPGTPADVAAVVTTLLSDELSGYVTGANIPVDGGLALHDWLTA